MPGPLTRSVPHSSSSVSTPVSSSLPQRRQRTWGDHLGVAGRQSANWALLLLSGQDGSHHRWNAFSDAGTRRSTRGCPRHVSSNPSPIGREPRVLRSIKTTSNASPSCSTATCRSGNGRKVDELADEGSEKIQRHRSGRVLVWPVEDHRFVDQTKVSGN